MKISVIIPTYKPLDYIWKCLDSLKNQTLDKEEFEVLIILNGCSEPWYSQIREYISRNNLNNFNLLQTNQPGVSNARNIGLKNAKGENITFIDDDDYVSENYLKEMLLILDQGYIPITNFQNFEDKTDIYLNRGKLQGQFYKINSIGEDVSVYKAKSFFSVPVCKAIPLKCIGNREFDTRFSISEDAIFMFLISDKLNRVKATPENVVYYRRVRLNSAHFRPLSFISILKNVHKCNIAYTKIYFSNPFNYNLLLYLNRIGANTIFGILSFFSRKKKK